ncbi:hypothetical protein J2X65_000532 [Ancylobacter sp. 3268]|uniref:hypothetical protein n=1 Tax=Ancylobacter sp. 3268 TaxID=2817752 RepID=UPI00285B6C91|nr:hypothetical protein [Ancylobacter sp. 3268]MDR6951184.1 hypothetical protein [Ancylobacter sp. 3268]
MSGSSGLNEAPADRSMNAATARDPVLGHILAVTVKANDHRAAIEQAGDTMSNGDEQRAVDMAADMLFVEAQRFLSDRSPSTVEGVAALLDFAVSDIGRYVFPDLTAEGKPFLPALMRVCAEALAKQCSKANGG